MIQMTEEEIALEQKKSMQEMVQGMKALTAHPAWSIFRALSEKHIHAANERFITASDRALALESPPTSSERLAGEIHGMRVLLSLPQAIIANEPEVTDEDSQPDVDE